MSDALYADWLTYRPMSMLSERVKKRRRHAARCPQRLPIDGRAYRARQKKRPR